MATERKYSEFKVGDFATFTKTITDADIILFAGVTGDVNSVHINEEYAKESMFKKRIAHGMISAGLISAVLGTQLPGPGTIYLSQTLKFRKPVYIGDTITARADIVNKIQNKNQLVLRTECVNQDDVTILTGEAVVAFAG